MSNTSKPPQPPNKSGTFKSAPRTTSGVFPRAAQKTAPGPVRLPEVTGSHVPRVTPENVGNMTNSQWQQLHGSDTKGIA